MPARGKRNPGLKDKEPSDLLPEGGEPECFLSHIQYIQVPAIHLNEGAKATHKNANTAKLLFFTNYA